MGHSLGCSQCWVPTGEGYPVLCDTEVLAVGTMGLIPCSLNEVLAMLGMGSLLELHQWSCETLAVATAFPLNALERSRTICHQALQSKGQRCVGRRESFRRMVLLCGAVQVLRSQMPGHWRLNLKGLSCSTFVVGKHWCTESNLTGWQMRLFACSF